jgi:hypothetical protein
MNDITPLTGLTMENIAVNAEIKKVVSNAMSNVINVYYSLNDIECFAAMILLSQLQFSSLNPKTSHNNRIANF